MAPPSRRAYVIRAPLPDPDLRLEGAGAANRRDMSRANVRVCANARGA